MPKRGSRSESMSARGGLRDVDWEAVDRAEATLDAMPNVLSSTSVTMLAQEVIARLAKKPVAQQQGPSDMSPMCDALIGAEDGAAMRMVLRLLAGGEAIESVYLDHLTCAARDLGSLWEADRVTAAQVTIAAGRIYMIMRGLGAHLTPVELPQGRHAVFAAVPNEDHTLGVSMAADLFRKAGWLIDLKIGASHDMLMEELAETEFSLLGLSASSKAVLPDLIRLIAAVRVSMPHVQVLVSGNIVRQVEDLRQTCDADAVAEDFETAQDALQAMWEKLGGPTRRILQ